MRGIRVWSLFTRPEEGIVELPSMAYIPDGPRARYASLNPRATRKSPGQHRPGSIRKGSGPQSVNSSFAC